MVEINIKTIKKENGAIGQEVSAKLQGKTIEVEQEVVSLAQAIAKEHKELGAMLVLGLAKELEEKELKECVEAAYRSIREVDKFEGLGEILKDIQELIEKTKKENK